MRLQSFLTDALDLLDRRAGRPRVVIKSKNDLSVYVARRVREKRPRKQQRQQRAGYLDDLPALDRWLKTNTRLKPRARISVSDLRAAYIASGNTVISQQGFTRAVLRLRPTLIHRKLKRFNFEGITLI